MILTGTESPLLETVARLAAAVAAASGVPVPPVRRPGGDLAGRAVVAIDDPLAALLALVAGGSKPAIAARALTAQAAPLVAHAGRVALLRRETTVGTAVAILRAAMGIADAAPLPGWNAADPLAGPPTEDAPPEIRALAEEIVRPLFAAAASGVAQPVLWSRHGLFWGDRPDSKLPRVIDLTGPARVLAYGPYCHLPAGSWTLRATLAFSPAAVGVPFAVELHGADLLGRGRITPPAPGVFAASFPALVTDTHVANEIRLRIEAGAIEGEIGVDHVRLVPEQDWRCTASPAPLTTWHRLPSPAGHR